MAKKILIVGGNAGGAAVAARLRRLNEYSEIILFEKGKHISYASCGLPYFVGNVIENREDLLVQTPNSMEAKFNLDVRTGNEVIDIDPDRKEVKVREDQSSEIYTEKYDKIVLSPGAEPVRPPINGLEEAENVFTIRDISDAENIKELSTSEKVQHAVVVGAGFIGLEMVENFHNLGLEVSVVEMMNQVMPPLDYDMATMVHNHLREKGLNLYLNDKVVAFDSENDKTKVILDSGRELYADIVILSTGVCPNTELAEKAGLELGDKGGIKVNERLETSEPDIYAVGDVIETQDCVTGDSVCVPLAGPTSKQARVAANSIEMKDSHDKYNCTLGTFVAKVFDLTLGCAGKNENELEEEGINYEKVFIFSHSHASYYPGASPLWLKLIFSPDTGRVYGAQLVGEDGVDKRIDVLATAIKFEKDVFDLQELDLSYAPPYSMAKDPVNLAGFAAGNMINQIVDTVHWHDLKSISQEDVTILDVRDKEELEEEGYIEGSVHIPHTEIRERIDEIPEDKEIICHCMCGLRSYIAARILQQRGYEVKNLSGGFNIYKAVEKDREARGLERIMKNVIIS